MQIAGRTHTGMVRKNNQDSYIIKDFESFSLLGVADGLGGHNAGEVASLTAVKCLKGLVEADEQIGFEILRNRMQNYIKDTNIKVFELSLSKQEYSNMGTTLCVALAQQHSMSIFNIGDSRAYLLSGDKITQITKDHSYVQQLIDEGRLSIEESLTYPQRNVILKALGTEATVEADRFDITLNNNEAVLFCTDGLTNNLSEQDILLTVNSNKLENVPGELILKANQNGGNDNITAVIYLP